MPLKGANGLWAPFEEIPLPHIPMDLEGANELPFGSSLWDFLPLKYKKIILHEKQKLETKEQMEKDRLLHEARMAQVFRETSESGICWMDEILERGEHRMCRNCYEALEEGLPPNRER